MFQRILVGSILLSLASGTLATASSTWDQVVDFEIPADRSSWLKLDVWVPAGTTVRLETCTGWGTFDDDDKGRPCDNRPVDPHRCEGGVVVYHPGLPVSRETDYRVCDTTYPRRSIFSHYLMWEWGREFVARDDGYLEIVVHDRKHSDNRGAYAGQFLLKFPE